MPTPGAGMVGVVHEGARQPPLREKSGGWSPVQRAFSGTSSASNAPISGSRTAAFRGSAPSTRARPGSAAPSWRAWLPACSGARRGELVVLERSKLGGGVRPRNPGVGARSACSSGRLWTSWAPVCEALLAASSWPRGRAAAPAAIIPRPPRRSRHVGQRRRRRARPAQLRRLPPPRAPGSRSARRRPGRRPSAPRTRGRGS
jgi:hypothetical protein